MWPFTGDQLRPGSAARPDAADERTHGRRLEDVADADRGVQGLPDAGRQPGRRQRVAAQVEESVGHRHRVGPQDVGEDRGHGPFGVGGRGDDLAAAEVGCGQRTAVDLARAAQRHLVEHGPHRRPHVLRQCAFGDAAHGVEIGAGGTGTGTGTGQVADEELPAPGCTDDGGRRVHHARRGRQHRFDLAEFDPLTAQLHLEVGAAQVLQLTVGRVAHQVAGAVEPLTGGAERVGDEPVGGQVGTGGVAARELDTTEIQFPGVAGADGTQAGVEHAGVGVPHRPADRHRRVAGVDLVTGDVDRGFGGAVQVVQPGIRPGGERGRGDRRGQRLAGGEHLSGCGGPGGVAGHIEERRQHRRHEVHGGDPGVGHRGGQVVRVAVAVRAGDDHGRAGHQRPEQLPHRHVEGHRRLLQDRVRSADRVIGLHPGQAVHDGAVGDGHALGAAGRPGREEGVGGVAGTQARAGDRVAVRHRAGRVDREMLDARGGHRLRGAVRSDQDERGTGRGHHVADPVGGCLGVQRHVGAAGGDDRVDRDEQLHRPLDGDTDRDIRSDSPGAQRMCECVAAGTELRVGDVAVAETQRHRVGGGPDRRGYGRGDGGVLDRYARPLRPAVDQGGLAGVDQVDIGRPAVRCGDQGGEGGAQVAADPLDVGVVEDARQVLERQAHAVAVRGGDQVQRVMGGVGGVDRADVESGGAAAVGERIGVHRVGLVHGQRVEQRRESGGAGDVGQAQMLVVQQPGLGRLQRLCDTGEGLPGCAVHHHRDGVDEQADGGLHTVDVGGPAGHGLTEGDRFPAGHAGQHQRPGDLQCGRRGNRVRTGERVQPGDEVSVEVDGEFARRLTDRGGRAGSNEGRAVDRFEGVPPRGEGGVAVATGEPGQEVAVVRGRCVDRCGVPGDIRGEEPADHQRSRPAVEQDVVVGDHQAVGAAGHPDQDEPDQSGDRHVEAGRALRAQQFGEVRLRVGGGAQIDGAPVGFDGVGHHRDGRTGGGAHVAGAQHRHLVHQGARRVAHAVGVHVATDLDAHLGEVDVDLARGGADLGLEQQSLLQRRQRPELRRREPPVEFVDVGLAQAGVSDVGAAAARIAGGGQIVDDAGQLTLPAAGDLADL